MGHLPYALVKQGRGAKGGRPQLRRYALPVVYECGPWTGCPLGTECPQAATQRGITYRLEVFRTREIGWGLRCWVRAGVLSGVRWKDGVGLCRQRLN